MNLRNAFLVTCASSLAVMFVGCGEDELFSSAEHRQGGSSAEPSVLEGAGEDAPPATDAAVRHWLLATKNDALGSELVALNLDTGAIDGRLSDMGKSGVSAASDLFAFYASTARDALFRLDDNAPWLPTASWSVPLGEAGLDASVASAQPIDVIPVSSRKAYVVFGARNTLGVVDPSVQGGATFTSFIDLSAYLSPFDSDGSVEAAAAYYVGPRKRLYVLLGSVDQGQKDLGGSTFVCTKVKAKVIAIDVNTNEVVSLSDGGAGYVELNGYSQGERDSLAYDPSLDRLLVMSRGCNESGIIARRQVEAVNLANGDVTSLLNLNDQPMPRALVRIDNTRVAIAFEGVSRLWNPALATLGDVLSEAPEVFTYDGNENLIGTRTVLGDAGVAAIHVVRTPLPASDGGTEATALPEAGGSPVATVVLHATPFSTLTGTVGRTQMWSR